MSWKNKQMRNVDGRTGVVSTATEGFMHIGLHIECDDGSAAYLQLNADGIDSGEKGWEWFCEGYDPGLGGPKWLLLGDHNETQESTHKSREMCA